jgi:hypothetical protein
MKIARTDVRPPLARSTLLVRLRKGRETYLRNLEFERCYRPGLELSLFERASYLAGRYRLPVLTTVFFTRPPAPAKLSYREVVAGHLVYERHFDVVRLWKQNPESLLRQGAAPATLVGLAQGCRPGHVRRAARLIAASFRGSERNQLLGILRALCAERFSDERMPDLIPIPVPSGTRAGPARAAGPPPLMKRRSTSPTRPPASRNAPKRS